MIDQIEFYCKNWIDPEETGIKGYVLYAKEIADSKAKPLLRIPQFDPTSPAMIRLALGTYDFLAEIEDAWGAKTEYIIAQSVSIIEPTIEERIEFEDSGIKEDIKGSGDSKCSGKSSVKGVKNNYDVQSMLQHGQRQRRCRSSRTQLSR